MPTKRRTTNLKTKSNQNSQKINLYGSLTTKELKKTHSCRQVGGEDRWPGWKGLMAAGGQGKVVAGGVGGPTLVCR